MDKSYIAVDDKTSRLPISVTNEVNDNAKFGEIRNILSKMLRPMKNNKAAEEY